MITAVSGNKKCIEYLVNKEANVNAKDKNGLTALMCAVKKEVNVNVNDISGKTALYFAVQHKYKEIGKLLLDSNNKR